MSYEEYSELILRIKTHGVKAEAYETLGNSGLSLLSRRDFETSEGKVTESYTYEGSVADYRLSAYSEVLYCQGQKVTLEQG